jgi:hypothetical protein
MYMLHMQMRLIKAFINKCKCITVLLVIYIYTRVYMCVCLIYTAKAQDMRFVNMPKDAMQTQMEARPEPLVRRSQ